MAAEVPAATIELFEALLGTKAVVDSTMLYFLEDLPLPSSYTYPVTVTMVSTFDMSFLTLIVSPALTGI